MLEKWRVYGGISGLRKKARTGAEARGACIMLESSQAVLV